MRARWAETAQREFDDAFRYLLEQRPATALEWREDVARMMAMLEDYPAIGHYHRRIPEGEMREVIVGRYRFIYVIGATAIEIRRVLHVRRDYDPQRIREGVPRGFPVFASAA